MTLHLTLRVSCPPVCRYSLQVRIRCMNKQGCKPRNAYSPTRPSYYTYIAILVVSTRERNIEISSDLSWGRHIEEKCYFHTLPLIFQKALLHVTCWLQIETHEAEIPIHSYRVNTRITLILNIPEIPLLTRTTSKQGILLKLVFYAEPMFTGDKPTKKISGGKPTKKISGVQDIKLKASQVIDSCPLL